MNFIGNNSKQRRKGDRTLHESKMTLIEGIRRNIENPGENEIVGDLLKSATPRERALVYAHLKERNQEHYRMGANIEAGVSERAIRAFENKEYKHGHIARYLSPKDIKRIFG